VADRDGQRGRRMVGSRRLGKAKNGLHHPLDLRLLGMPVAADHLLDPVRGVLSGLNTCARARDEHGSAGLPDRERDAGVCADVGLLEHDGIRAVLLDELRDPLEDRLQAQLGPLARGRPPRPVVERSEAASALLNDSEPACRSPRRDAQYLPVAT